MQLKTSVKPIINHPNPYKYHNISFCYIYVWSLTAAATATTTASLGNWNETNQITHFPRAGIPKKTQ